MAAEGIARDGNALIKTLACGPLGVNCYIAGSIEERKVVIIDPGGNAPEITQFIEQEGLVPTLIIATHGHLDHIMAIPELSERWGVPVACHTDEIPVFLEPDPLLKGFFGGGYTPFKPEKALNDGDMIRIGTHTLEVIHTPGHTPGSICLLCPPLLFSGDTLFRQGVGRTDFSGGSYNALVHSIRNRLWTLPDELILLPGHGEPSVLGEEKAHGFF
ncbi:MAG: MBL fold metallo-hydrolase [bacterium]